MVNKVFTTINNLRCVKTSSGLFTEGEVYSVNPYYSEEGNLMILSDGSNTVYVSPQTLQPEGLTGYQFEIVEKFPAVSDEYEEEELKRLEKKLEQRQQTQDPCCDVALAYQLSQIQKYLRDSGADIDLVIRKDCIALLDENCKEYRGNVEQILRFVKVSGEMSKVAEEMVV